MRNTPPASSPLAPHRARPQTNIRAFTHTTPIAPHRIKTTNQPKPTTKNSPGSPFANSPLPGGGSGSGGALGAGDMVLKLGTIAQSSIHAQVCAIFSVYALYMYVCLSVQTVMNRAGGGRRPNPPPRPPSYNIETHTINYIPPTKTQTNQDEKLARFFHHQPAPYAAHHGAARQLQGKPFPLYFSFLLAFVRCFWWVGGWLGACFLAGGWCGAVRRHHVTDRPRPNQSFNATQPTPTPTPHTQGSTPPPPPFCPPPPPPPPPGAGAGGGRRASGCSCCGVRESI